MIMTAIHQNLSAGKWNELSLAEQMGNVGSEVSRAIAAQEYGNEARQEHALDRMFELMDLTIADHCRDPGLKELTRAREVVADYFYGDNVYQSTAKNIDRYFFQFALMARQTH